MIKKMKIGQCLGLSVPLLVRNSLLVKAQKFEGDKELEGVAKQMEKWWLRGKYASPFQYEIVTHDFMKKPLDRHTVATHVYTPTHLYSIVAHSGYLGCTFSNRRPNPGEDWTRGNDLADGDFNIKTWNEIISDIVSNETTSIIGHIKRAGEH